MRGRERDADLPPGRERDSDRLLTQDEVKAAAQVRDADAATRARIDDLTHGVFRKEPDAAKVLGTWRQWRDAQEGNANGDAKERRAFSDFDQMFANAHNRVSAGQPVLRSKAPDARKREAASYVSPIRRRQSGPAPQNQARVKETEQVREREPDTIPQEQYREEVREVEQDRKDVHEWERVRNAERGRYALAEEYGDRADKLRVADASFATWSEKRRQMLDRAPEVANIEKGMEYLRALDARTRSHPSDEKNVRHALVVGEHVRDMFQQERLKELKQQRAVSDEVRGRSYELQPDLEADLRNALDHPSFNDRDFLSAEFRRLHALEERSADETRRMELVVLARDVPPISMLQRQWGDHAGGRDGQAMGGVGASAAEDLRLRAARHVSCGRDDDRLKAELERHRVAAALNASGVVRDAAEFNAMQAAAMIRYVELERARPRSEG